MTDDVKWYVYPGKTGPYTLADAKQKAAEKQIATGIYTWYADAEGNFPT